MFNPRTIVETVRTTRLLSGRPLYSSIPPKFKNRVARLITLRSKHAHQYVLPSVHMQPARIVARFGAHSYALFIQQPMKYKSGCFHGPWGWLDVSLHQTSLDSLKKSGVEGCFLNEVIDSLRNELIKSQTTACFRSKELELKYFDISNILGYPLPNFIF